MVYQVYPRSSLDSDADGISDIRGVTSRIGYLSALGIDAIWLSPFDPRLADGGYDVADYRNVAPELGTLEDFDVLIAAAHAVGIRVIVDIVPNHTSSLHPGSRRHWPPSRARRPGRATSSATAQAQLPPEPPAWIIRLRRPSVDLGARRPVVLPPVRA